MNEEDVIIAESFNLIREGVLYKDWTKIISAYENITGEKLELPEEKISRLDNIRQLMKEKKPKGKKGKKKQDKIEVATPEEVEELTEVAIESSGKMQIITSPYDPDEASLNASIAAKKPKITNIQKRVTEIDKLDTSGTEKDVRFYKNPPKAAPWH